MIDPKRCPETRTTKEAEFVSLPKRDWFLIPLLTAVTTIVLAGGGEFVARKAFPTVWPRIYTMINDPITGERAKPNSEFKIKLPEGTLADFTFNSCGNRTNLECGPKPPGVFRIVLVGSSVAFGWFVPREQTFAETLPAQLSEMTGRTVDVYNDAMLWGTPHGVFLRLKGALSVQPDMILWVITSHDIQHSEQILPDGVPGSDEEKPAETTSRATTLSHGSSILELVASKRNQLSALLENHYRTLLALRHYLYKSQTNYVKHYLMSDDSSGSLRVRTDPSWQHHLQRLDYYMNEVANQARTANVPLVVVLVPNRAQAALISAGNWPDGIDPYKIGESVRTIVEHHGGTYIDILHDFSKIPNPEQHFYPVDGHPDGQGHAIISQILARKLTGGVVPSLAVARKSASKEGSGT